uniref:CTD nuclear envelope phosphatase 1 n=1 Tax=Vombatus ursinus TaxID=29139 RepID=A0A4X2K2G5_VOMUR
ICIGPGETHSKGLTFQSPVRPSFPLRPRNSSQSSALYLRRIVIPTDPIQGSETQVSNSISVYNDKTIITAAIKHPWDIVWARVELYGCLALIWKGFPLVKSPYTSSCCLQIIQYQTVRYDILPLSPVSRNRLAQVKRKILVLDLDETLIHSHHDGVLRPTVRPGTPPDFILKVVIDKHPVRFFVHKRPHVDFFLEVVSQWYELVVFTASMEIYGSAVADKLDNSRSILKRRYYRQHCTLELGSYIKDLSVVHSDLSSIVILDNSPGAYRSHPDNAIPIKSWFSDPSDTALLNLLPMLDALRFTADVRSVLSRNLHQHRLW